MANPFDQFDSSASSANPFDQFDAPQQKPSGLARRAADIPLGLAKGVVDLPAAVVGLADIPTNGLAGKAVGAVTDTLGQAADAVGLPAGARPSNWSKQIGDMYSPEVKQAQTAVHQGFAQGEQAASDAGDGTIGKFVGGAKGGLAVIASNPSAIIPLIAESYGGMKAIAKGTAHALAPAAAKYNEAVKAGTMTREAADAALATAAGRTAAVGEGLLTAGQNTAQVEQENPDATFGDRAMQGLAGAITGGISRGVSKIPGLGDVEANMALKDVGSTARTGLSGGRLAAAGKGVLSEGVLEELPQSLQEQVWQNLGTNKAWDSGLAEQGISGLIAGAGMGGAMGFAHAQPKTKLPDAGPLSAAVNAGIDSGATSLDAPLALGYQAGPPLVNFPDGTTMTQAEYQQHNAQQEQSRLDGMIQPISATPEQVKALGYQPGTPLVVFPDGTAMTRAEYAQREAEKEQSRLDGMVQPADKPEVSAPQPGSLAAAAQKPNGSFSNMDELAGLIGQEKQDVEGRRQNIADTQQLRRDVEISDADSRVADAMAKESAARRRDVLNNVLADESTVDHAKRFSAELKRQGFRDTAPTESELATVQRFNDIKNAQPAEPVAEPAQPNELDAGAVGIKERAAKVAPEGGQRDKLAEIKQLVAQGWKVSGKTLVSPTGKKRNINFAERYAAFKAKQELSPNASQSLPEPEIQPAEQSPAAEQTSVVAAEPKAKAPEVTSAAAPEQVAQEAPQTNDAQAGPQSGAAPEAESVAPQPKAAPKKAGPQNRDDLVGAILRVTGGNGIAANQAQTITGDKAGSANAKVRGLFTNDGTADLGDVAMLLREEEGYHVKDGEHLSELIREQASGNPVYSMERTEREAADNAEKQHKSEVSKKAEELGLKKIGGRRTLQVVEAEIAKVESDIADQEAKAERAAIQAEAFTESIIEEGSDLTEADLMQWLGSMIDYTQDEINEANSRASEIESRRAEANAIASSEESAQGSRGAGNEAGQAEAGARETEGFGLARQTNEQAAEQFAQQQAGEQAEPTKAQADRERDAVPFSLGQQSQPKPQGVQTGLFTADGRVSSEAKPTEQSQPKTDSAPEVSPAKEEDNAPAADSAKEDVKPEEVSASVVDQAQSVEPATQETVEPAQHAMEPNWDSFADFWNGLIDGKASIDDVKESFAAILDRADEFKASISKLKNDQLKRMIGYARPDDKKADLVAKVYDRTLGRFTLNKDIPSMQWSYGENLQKVQAEHNEKIRAIVNGLTDSDLAEFVASIEATKSEREARTVAQKAAVADPKTVEDFDTALRLKKSEGMTFAEARMSLTPEQRAEYDRLKGIESRDQRKARADQQKTDIRVASQTTDGQVIETNHTKTGEPLFVVKAAERVDRDVYNQWNATAKRMGGHYSSFRGNGAVPGFQFKTRENADAFLSFVGGNAEAAKEVVQERRDSFADDRSQSAVERLNEMAERLEERADESLGRERKANTERRARFAASAESAANAEKAMAKTMRRIASAIGDGTTKFLDRVRQKAQVEFLASTLRTAKGVELRTKYPSYVDQQRHEGEQATGETADYAEFPQYSMMRSDLANLARKMVSLPNMKLLGQRILKVADDSSAAYNAFAKDHLLEVSKFGKADGSGWATFTTMKDAERSIEVSNLSAVAVPLQIKRGEYRIVLSPSEAINRGIWKGDDRKIVLSHEVGEEIVEKLGRLNRKHGKQRGMDAPPEAPWQFENAYNNRKRLAGLGIEQPWEFRAALREFADLKEAPKEADKIKAMERAMIGRKNDGLDFFPTPAETAQAMIDAAEIKEGMSVLEPSAGMGHIAEQIRDVAGIDPDVVEFNGDRRELLEAKGFNVIGNDFMDMSPRGFTYGDVFRAPDGTVGVMRGGGGLGSNRVGLQPLDESGRPDARRSQWVDRDSLEEVEKRGLESGYDRIIMNPPFSDRRDAEHVQHAYSLLRPGGRVVAIMGDGVFFGQDKRAIAFRDWLESVGGTSEKLAEGTFLDPSLPVNTGVNARMVVIDKPAGESQMSRGAGAGMAIRDLKAVADRIKKGFKNLPNIHVLEDPSYAPEALRDFITKAGATDDVEGATHEGEIYLFASGLSSEERAEHVLATHEITHYGLRGTIGSKGLDSALNAIWMNNKDVRDKARALRERLGMTSNVGAVEEVLADMTDAELVKLKGWKKLAQVVRDWLHSAGFEKLAARLDKLITGSMSDQEKADLFVSNMVRNAREWVKNGKPARGYDPGTTMLSSDTAESTGQTDTEAFRKWFGDSQVVDAKGNPQVVYHGSPDVRGIFSDGFKAKSRGSVFFAAADYAVADSYADDRRAFDYQNAEPQTVPLYLSIKNPMVIDANGALWKDTEHHVEAAKLAGHDGIVIKNSVDFYNNQKGKGKPTTVYAWFAPTQAKSAVDGQLRSRVDRQPIAGAIGNNGQFDATNPDIRFSRASAAVADLLKPKAQIIGNSGRDYTPEQRAFFKGAGRDIDKKSSIAKTLDYLQSDFWKKMAVGIVDQFRGLRDLNDNGLAYMLARLSKGTAGAFDALLHHGKLSVRDGVYDADQSGGFVDRLGTPLHGELDDFLWHVAANRAEKLSAEDRENLFTPEYIAAGKSLADGTTNFDYTVQTGPLKGNVTRNRSVIYADANRVFNEFQKNTLDIAEESGLIDPEARKYWESEFYVPFYRVSEDDGEFVGAKMGNALVRQQAFKKLKGGTDKLNSDLLSNTLMNFSHLIEASAKNRAAKAALEAAGNMGAATRVAANMGEYANANGAMLPPGTKKTVWYQDGGKKIEYLVDDPFVMTAITSLEYAGMRNGIMGAMAKFKGVLTMGVTASPAFKVRNLIRDSIQAIGTSDLSANPIKNVVEGWKLTNKESQTYVSALASGGLIRFGTMLEGSESSRVRQLVKQGVKDSSILDSENKVRAFYDQYLEPAVSAYNELGNRSEEINRAALYDQLIKQGKSHAEAALMARDLMDFSMQGSFNTIRFLTQVVPFMNARLQGLYKLGRAAKDDPAKMAMTIGACALASVGLMLAYRDDDDWKRREDFDRDGFWWLKFAGTEFRIPKPFEVGAVASIAERGLEYLIDDEMTGERFAKVMGDMVMNNLSMNPVPQMVKPIIDLYANKDSFTGRPIETQGMQKLDKERRFNSSTSMVARGLSSATGGAMSPVQYDHLARAYFGWLGSFVVGGADMASRAVSDEPTRPAADYFKLATQGFLKEEGTGGSRYTSMVYDQAQELERAYGTYRQLLKDGKIQEAKEYSAEHKEQLGKYKSVEAVKRGESLFNERIRMIERSKMDPEAKKEKINAINKQKESLAKMVAPGL